MCGCMNVWIYECDLNDHINCIWQVTWWNKTGRVRLEADWQRSTNTRQTSLELILSWTNRAIGGMKPGTRWQPMPLGKPAHCWSKVWEKSPFVNGSHLLRFQFVLRIPNFCLDCPCGFSVHREYIPFCVPNFCLDCPFGFSVHRDALYCLSRLFRFFAQRALFCIIFLDCDCILLEAEILSVVLSRVSLPNVTVLEACADVCFIYSRVQRECVYCSHFSKDVKRRFVILKKFVSSIAIRNRRIFANRIEWEFQINGHRLKFDELSGDPPMAWLHRSLKNLENGKYMGRVHWTQ